MAHGEDYNCEAKIAELGGKVNTLGAQVKIALDGVSNFERFRLNDFPALRTSVENFHTESRTRESERTNFEEQKAAAISTTLTAHNESLSRKLKIWGIGIAALVSLLVGGATVGVMLHEDHNKADFQQTVRSELGATK